MRNSPVDNNAFAELPSPAACCGGSDFCLVTGYSAPKRFGQSICSIWRDSSNRAVKARITGTLSIYVANLTSTLPLTCPQIVRPWRLRLRGTTWQTAIPPGLATNVKHWRGVSGESAPNCSPVLDFYRLPTSTGCGSPEVAQRIPGQTRQCGSVPHLTTDLDCATLHRGYAGWDSCNRPRNEPFHRPRIGLHHFKFLRQRFNPLIARRTRRLSAESFQHALFEFCR